MAKPWVFPYLLGTLFQPFIRNDFGQLQALEIKESRNMSSSDNRLNFPQACKAGDFGKPAGEDISPGEA